MTRVAIIVALWAGARVATAEVAGPTPRGSARLSMVVVDGNGIPNALRAGAAAGMTWARGDRWAIATDITAIVGNADAAGRSYRIGTDVEASFRLPEQELEPYASVGFHYFRRDVPEKRRGVLYRAAMGARVLLTAHAYVAAEMGVERLPDGDGNYTPLRSRWALDTVFVIVGFAR